MAVRSKLLALTTLAFAPMGLDWLSLPDQIQETEMISQSDLGEFDPQISVQMWIWTCVKYWIFLRLTFGIPASGPGTSESSFARKDNSKPPSGPDSPLLKTFLKRCLIIINYSCLSKLVCFFMALLKTWPESSYCRKRVIALSSREANAGAEGETPGEHCFLAC